MMMTRRRGAARRTMTGSLVLGGGGGTGVPCNDGSGGAGFAALHAARRTEPDGSAPLPPCPPTPTPLPRRARFCACHAVARSVPYTKRLLQQKIGEGGVGGLGFSERQVGRRGGGCCSKGAAREKRVLHAAVYARWVALSVSLDSALPLYGALM
ncbi:hypothetical protein JKP88DRAFT_234266 [Tribonema minus]|uniref:Uncharacterized protein n=1 Tax=Tribonema minus TaxID=303371 RepID=A0A835ZBK2_9STRA|nr:hypothetical protein JKP88DRAFT_234266 [Tribonema minus]